MNCLPHMAEFAHLVNALLHYDDDDYCTGALWSDVFVKFDVLT